MSLADRLADGAPSSHHNSGCTVGHYLQQLSDGDAEALRQALDDRSWRHSDLANVLCDEGLDVTDHTVGRHRRGACQCDAAGLA